MKIDDWSAVPELSHAYRRIRELGLEQNVAELEAFGFTIFEPGRAAPVEWVNRLRDKLLEVAERRTGARHDLEAGIRGKIDAPGLMKSQYILWYLLLEDRLFEEAVMNPYVLALQTYLLGFECRLSNVTAFVKWQCSDGYGPGLGLHADTPVPETLLSGPHTGNASWLLTDYTRENGALAVVPGSHRWNRHPNRNSKEGVRHAVPLEAPAGSLVVWNGNLWHGGFPRTNPGLRLTLVTYWNRPHLLPQEDYRHTVTEEILARNPKRLAVMLGLANFNEWRSGEGPQIESARRWLEEAAREEGFPPPSLGTAF